MTDAKITTEVVENYLKAIYHAHERDGASPQTIAAQMRVSASAVSKMLRHLERRSLVQYSPYKPVQLTPEGEKIALEIIRHHRLLEAYLVQSLSYGWEKAHAEADRLEHHISEEFEARIEQMLGFPEFDPHGDPIPTRDGRIGAKVTTALASLAPPAQTTVRRVTDEDAALLEYLADRGIRPGARISLTEIEPFGGSLLVAVDGVPARLSPGAARNVFVTLDSPDSQYSHDDSLDSRGSRAAHGESSAFDEIESPLS